MHLLIWLKDFFPVNKVIISILMFFYVNVFYFISLEKGMDRAQMLCYSPLLTIVTHHVFDSVHSCDNTFTLHIHTNVTSIIQHVQNYKIVIHN